MVNLVQDQVMKEKRYAGITLTGKHGKGLVKETTGQMDNLWVENK